MTNQEVRGVWGAGASHWGEGGGCWPCLAAPAGALSSSAATCAGIAVAHTCRGGGSRYVRHQGFENLYDFKRWGESDIYILDI